MVLFFFFCRPSHSLPNRLEVGKQDRDLNEDVNRNETGA